MFHEFKRYASRVTRLGAFILVPISLIAFLPGTARSVYAAGWVVNTLTDRANGSCAKTCTLRDAMTLSASGDTITFSVSGTITLNSTLPSVTKTLTIDGTGQSVTIGGGDQVLNVSGGNLTLKRLTVAGGREYTAGGGVYNTGTLTISNSTFSRNVASSISGSGGGVWNSGTLTISDSTFSDNSALGGGGLYNKGMSTIRNSTFSGNLAEGGGGVWNSGTLTISNSTFSDNSARIGGGVLSLNGTLTISNSTFSGNSALGGGGVVSGNGMLNLGSSIVAGNTVGPGGHSPDIAGSVTSLGHNLIGDSSYASGLTNGVNGDQVGTGVNPIYPELGRLASNGGSTQTMSILTSSPAYRAGNCAGSASVNPPAPAVTTDQRGVNRKPSCDVGAFEPPPTTTHKEWRVAGACDKRRSLR